MNVQGNGTASLWGDVTNVIKDKANEAAVEIVSTAVTQTLEQKRKSLGQSKFKFYGDIIMAWFKSHIWLFAILVPGFVVALFLFFRWIWRKIKGRKSNKKRR